MPENDSSRSRLFVSEAILLVGVGLLTSYAAWARGGTVVSLQWPFLWLALFISLLLIVGPLVDGAARSDVSIWLAFGRRIGRIVTDPVTGFFGVFLVLLLIQWLNAGRERVYDFAAFKWVYGPPPQHGLPGAIQKDEALEMLRWFVPACVAALAVRHGLKTRYALRTLFGIILANACVLCCVGVAQFVSGTNSIYWMFPDMGIHFFAGFGYQNHGAAYCFLCMCLTLGFLIRLIRQGDEDLRRSPELWGWVGLLLLFLLSAHLALSRGVAVLCWVAMGMGLATVWATLSGNLPPAVRFNGALGLTVAVLAAGYLVLEIGGERFDNEMETLRPQSIRKGFTVRAWQIESAWRMWQGHKLYGVGGWGYRHMVGLYTDKALWPLIELTGKANVHNDAIQFLTEFGLVGVVAMAGAVCWMVGAAWRDRSSGLVKFIIIGIGGVFLYSNVDLPFRCPAVLYVWSVMLAGASVYGKRPESQPA